MRYLTHAVAFFAFAVLTLPLLAQTPAPAAPQNLYAFGLSYNDYASPKIAGTALYAHLLDANAGTYAFAVYDILPTKGNKTVTSNVGAGVAQKLFTIGKIPIYVPLSAGFSFNGQNTGWAWSGGGMADFHIKGNWRLFPNVRFVKSSVNANSGYQLIGGAMLSFGK